jgi:Protein of unknown function (DUF1566)
MEVPRASGGNYARTECVQDRITGLIWEGKTAAGTDFRSSDRTFSNFVSSNALNNTGGYVANVNASGLCGFNDWRLPTAVELQSLVDYHLSTGDAMIDANWFPNTPAGASYWAAWSNSSPWAVDFGIGTVWPSGLPDWMRRVRLVRGQMIGTQRGDGSCTTAAIEPRYAFSASGEEVTDLRTRLTWARCLVGQSWSGSTCTGAPTYVNHDAALGLAKAATGWRLPSIKELSSLVDRNCGDATFDARVFPAARSAWSYWSSTPKSAASNYVWTLQPAGTVAAEGNAGVRVFDNAVWLVRE